MKPLGSNLLFVLCIAAATMAAWVLLARPLAEPAWPERVEGYSFSPLRAWQDPTRNEYPSLEELDDDLEIVARSAHSVRTYSIDGTLEHVPEIAARHGLDVTLGVWLDEDRAANAARLERVREIAARSDNVSRVVIGNEVLLRGDLSMPELTAILMDARRDLDVPVGTAEPWHLRFEHPELAAEVEFIAVHLLPYWEGIHVDEAVDYVADRMERLRSAFGEKPILIGEVGWPSYGRTRGRASASHADAASFLRRFLERAESESYDYFLMEAFDQPWKRANEGDVGAYWGVFDAGRAPKFDLDGPVVPIRDWGLLALGSVLLAAAAFQLMVADGRGLRPAGRLFLAVTAAVLTTGLLWMAGLHAEQYWTGLDVLTAVVSGIGVLGMALLICVEAHEWAESRWALRRRAVPERPPVVARQWPKVSIHVPAHAEPPEMLVETLRALADLEYPNFEVIVIDNNTRDGDLWRPVETCCERLGERFRFFHVEQLEGYKAGALNFALRRCAPDAEIIAVVDSDYKVEPDWLRDLVPHFDSPKVAIVQAPQAYRDADDSAFKSMCDAEYQGFFRIGMVTRNDRNAIIQHGTMTMIRRVVLDEVGGWAEWTITEDAELGLRVLEHGYETVYTPRCYGRGLTPDHFQSYKSQRYRWALGAVQILRRHRRELLGAAPSALTRGQRYHFFGGWLAWLGDGGNLLFNVVAVAWSAAMIAAPAAFPPPLAGISTLVIGLFAFKLVKVLHLYRTEVRASWLECVGAALAGLALIHIVGRAVIAGLYSRQAHFCRTPKLARRATLAGAFAAALPETAFAAALLASAFGVATTPELGSIDRTMWCVLLVVFALPHLAALCMSLIGVLPAMKRRASSRLLGNPVTEARRG